MAVCVAIDLVCVRTELASICDEGDRPPERICDDPEHSSDPEHSGYRNAPGIIAKLRAQRSPAKPTGALRLPHSRALRRPLGAPLALWQWTVAARYAAQTVRCAKSA